MSIRRIMFVLVLFCTLLVSCVSGSRIPVSDSVREHAYEISSKYIGKGYAWGGQDFWYVEDGVVDCSGLVINIYKEACENHGIALPFEDATASELCRSYTIPVVDPKRGDLIFMGTEDVVSHVAVFYHQTDGQIVFLDAYSVTGKVEIRQYPAADKHFISFGRMRVA